MNLYTKSFPLPTLLRLKLFCLYTLKLSRYQNTGHMHSSDRIKKKNGTFSISFSLSLSKLQFFVPPFSYALNCKRKFLRVRILVPMTKKTTCCIHVRAQKKAHGSILIIIITIHERKEMYRLFSMNDVS